MTDSRGGRSSPTPAAPDTARVDERNPIWNFYHVDNTQSWGPISASVFSRPAGEVDWRSDYHRIAYDPVGFTAGTVQVENGPMRELQYLANTVSFVPRGVQQTRLDWPSIGIPASAHFQPEPCRR